MSWEHYERQSYIYWVSSLDFETPFFMQNQEVLSEFLSQDFIDALGASFGVSLTRCKDATFHKMEKGHFSRRHTDSNKQGEKVRVIYYVTPPCQYDGGELMLFHGDFEQALYYTHKLPENSLFGFLMTDDSYHEAREVLEGTRICLVLTYC